MTEPFILAEKIVEQRSLAVKHIHVAHIRRFINLIIEDFDSIENIQDDLKIKLREIIINRAGDYFK